jgi:hypothetical protein
MTTERMLELLILNKFMDRYNNMSPKVKGLTEKMISIPQSGGKAIYAREGVL